MGRLRFVNGFVYSNVLMSLLEACRHHSLGVRDSTWLLVIRANRLARRSLTKTMDWCREAASRCFVLEGGFLLSDLR